MDFEWFEAKRLKTFKERGLDFRDAWRLFDGPALYAYPSPHAADGPAGLLEQRFIAVVWVGRGLAGTRRRGASSQ
jgi:uncharacterized DUF497 family protein